MAVGIKSDGKKSATFVNVGLYLVIARIFSLVGWADAHLYRATRRPID